MKTDKQIGKVFYTENLDQFKHLDSNRELKNRVEKVKKSIAEYGWINSPIVCNEKMQVVDGQARLQACKELGCGLSYTVINGLTVKECRILNSVQANWNYRDYIKSYANSGNQAYRWLDQLLIKMKAEWGSENLTVLRQIIGNDATNIIKNGTVKMSEKEYNTAAQHVAYVGTILKYFKEAGLNNEKVIYALYFCSRVMPKEVKNRLAKACESRLTQTRYKAPRRALDALKIIDDVYNYKKRKADRYYIVREYEDRGGIN